MEEKTENVRKVKKKKKKMEARQMLSKKKFSYPKDLTVGYFLYHTWDNNEYLE